MQRTELVQAAEFFRAHCAEEQGADTLYLPGWTTDDWVTLLSEARLVELSPNEVLIKRGLAERSLFLVVSGALEVNARGSGGSMGLLFREGPGALIGEIAFFDGGKRSATVWAIKPTRLLSLERKDVETFAALHPQRGLELVFALGRVLAFHVRRSEQRLAADTF
jgi:CRP-like cAMP-binding protein